MIKPQTAGSLRWYGTNRLGVRHAMLCRRGGAGKKPYATLNLSYGVGDDPDIVLANRELVKRLLGIQHLVSAVQVHADQVFSAENIDMDTEVADADALISSQPGVGLLVQQADCQAVLLHDPVKGVIAAIHNGWRGTTRNILTKTIQAMERLYGVKARDLRAVISPSLGPCCAEFLNFRSELPPSYHTHQSKPFYFDFWAISHEQLVKAGLKSERIENAEICTVCNDDFFSYRRAVKKGNGITGRNGSVIVLPCLDDERGP